MPASDLWHVQDHPVESSKSKSSLPHHKHRCQLAFHVDSTIQLPAAQHLATDLHKNPAYLPNHHLEELICSDFVL